MSSQLISIYALVAMFVIATIVPINMGVLAFVGAYLVGTLVAGMATKDIIAGFPGGLSSPWSASLISLPSPRITARSTGWCACRFEQYAVGSPRSLDHVRNFGSPNGSRCSEPRCGRHHCPHCAWLCGTYSISPLMMGLMVIHGAQGGGFSPISIYGGITNRIVAQAGLPLSEMTTFLASLVVNWPSRLSSFCLRWPEASGTSRRQWHCRS